MGYLRTRTLLPTIDPTLHWRCPPPSPRMISRILARKDGPSRTDSGDSGDDVFEVVMVMLVVVVVVDVVSVVSYEGIYH